MTCTRYRDLKRVPLGVATHPGRAALGLRWQRFFFGAAMKEGRIANPLPPLPWSQPPRGLAHPCCRAIARPVPSHAIGPVWLCGSSKVGRHPSLPFLPSLRTFLFPRRPTPFMCLGAAWAPRMGRAVGSFKRAAFQPKPSNHADSSPS